MAGKYDRITFRGRSFDRITAAGVEHFEYLLGHQVSILQGPFSTSVGASGGTHSGSGAIDIDPRIPGKSVAEIQWAGRLAGWALYHRPTLAGEWNEHYHGIQIGNEKVSPAAAKQIQDYFHGLDALASHRPDPTPRPNPIVPFKFPIGTVDLSNVRDQAKKKSGQKSFGGVKQIQQALNLKSGTTLKTDGVFGPTTKAAYARWEIQKGGDGDGLPSIFALKLLGAARFRVIE